MIPGEPLLLPSGPRYRLPGVGQPPNPVRRTAALLVVITAIGLATTAVVGWILDDPLGPGTCLDFSNDQVAQPQFNPDRGEWLYAGKVVGYSATADPACVSPVQR